MRQAVQRCVGRYRSFTSREPNHGYLRCRRSGAWPDDDKRNGGTMTRILVLLALSAVGVLTNGTAAQAEVVTNETVSYAYAGWVPCANGGAGELVTGTIDVHILATSTINTNVDAWQFAFEPRGSLVGTMTGDTYRLTGVTRGTYVDSLQSGKYTATYVNRYRLIGPGTGNNLVVRETAHVTRDGDDLVVDHDNFAIECK